MWGDEQATDVHAAWQGAMADGVDERCFHLDSDGATLFVRHWQPPHRPAAVVQLLHGMGEHSGRYRHVASALAARGWAVYCHDHRGHGRTAGSRERLGLLAERHGWHRALGDARQVNLYTREAHPDLPVAMVGHSMGSFLAQHYAIEYGTELTALALSGSDTRADPSPLLGSYLAGAIAALFGPRYRSHILKQLTAGTFRNRFEEGNPEALWRTRDASVIEACRQDPLCGFEPTAAMWRDVLEGVHIICRRQHRRRVPSELPILLMVGGSDPLSDRGRRIGALRDAYFNAGVREIGLYEYTGARHEIFNETNRAEVIADLLAWLAQRLPTDCSVDSTGPNSPARVRSA